MKILSNYIRFFLIVFVGFTTFTTSTIDADAVDIWGSVHVCAYPFNCIPRYTPAASGYGPYIYDTETLLGPGNNWAESEYLGDISKGFVGAWARATWADGIFEARAMSDFAYQKYLRFISISVPPEVTWTSTDEFLVMPIDACRGDFDKDGDVDRSDLSELTFDLARLDLKLFAARLGRSDCQPW